MLYDEIAKRRGWVRIEPVNEGWSGEEKFHVWDEEGREYLLRIADGRAEGIMRLGFEALRELQGLPVPEAVEMGRLEDRVYAIFSWLEGRPLEGLLLKPSLPELDERRQYALGVTAGRALRVMHRLPAPPDTPEWGERFNRKIDRKLQMYADCPLKYDCDEPLIRHLAENRQLLEGRPQSFQHGDYHVGNMVLSPAGRLGVIDFNRADVGDPWEEFNRIVWSAQASPAFASGQVYGYFNGDVPEKFWRLLGVYIVSNTLSSLPWAVSFGEAEIRTMRRQHREIMEWYDDFRSVVPKWYYRPRFERDRSSLQCGIFPLGAGPAAGAGAIFGLGPETPTSTMTTVATGTTAAASTATGTGTETDMEKGYVFVVVLSRYQGKWMLSRHRKRSTWETQGGHIEPGETPEQTARRELYEESGAKCKSIRPVFDYVGWDEFGHAAGVVFYAEIEEMGTMPDSEMAEVRLFDGLPAELTYPQVTPKLFKHLAENFL